MVMCGDSEKKKRRTKSEEGFTFVKEIDLPLDNQGPAAGLDLDFAPPPSPRFSSNFFFDCLQMPIQITLEKHVHCYVGLNKQGQPRSICVIRVSKGPALVNDKTDAVELGELEREINTETLSFNNVQSQENDYWQDLEILLENDVRLQANDDNEVDENIDDYRDGMDINVDDQNV
ncbi:Uncharacterized protein Fot_40053 [Forsythia ovata]|uniref:Uncharacterized protein n=1 Tax=Forsythia ovata TaxID=205694 RepID=A0ABD1S6C4_9LAMI